MSTTATEKKKEPGMPTLILVLGAISAATALALGLLNMATAPSIAKNEQAKKDAAMEAVLPSTSGYEELSYGGDDTTVQAIFKAGDAGYVVQVAPAGSFSGTFTIMVGVDNEGVCTGAEVVATAETSGLGANASKEVFKGQFDGKTADNAALEKDGGGVTMNGMTGATITARCMATGVISAIQAAGTMG